MRHLVAAAMIPYLFAVPPALAADAIRASDGPQLLLDDHVVERLDGVTRVLHSPQRRDVSLVFDSPWEGPQSGYATVLRAHDGGYRLYYRGGGDNSHESVCVAFSDDGIRWSRPKLGLVELDGSRENNILIRPGAAGYREAHNFAPFLDTNPEARPDERYKAVGLTRAERANGEGHHRALAAFASPDGLRWRRLRDEPVMTEGGFDSLNTVFWDSNLGKYVCYLRSGRAGVRSVQRAVSEDFVNWSAPQWLDFGDAPAEQLYTNGIIPYFRAPQLYLGFPMRFLPGRKTIGADGRAIDGTSDALFMTSRDGLRWRRFGEAYIRPGPDPANWGHAHGNQTPVWGILPASEAEISVYWLEHYGTVPRVVRGVVRTDGFASIRAGARGGKLITRPLVIDATAGLELNLATSAAGSVRVELQDQSGRAIPGFALEDCDPIWGDEVGRRVRWRGGHLRILKDRTVRIRFEMHDADLYSFRFVAEPDDP